MIKFNKHIFILLGVIATTFGIVACDEEPTDALMEIIEEDLGYVPRIARFTMVQPTPAGATTTVAAGATLVFDLRYWSEGTIKDIQFYRIEGANETKIGEVPYAKAFSKITLTDSLRWTYQAPALASGTTFSIQARVSNTGLENYPARSANINLKIE